MMWISANALFCSQMLRSSKWSLMSARRRSKNLKRVQREQVGTWSIFLIECFNSEMQLRFNVSGKYVNVISHSKWLNICPQRYTRACTSVHMATCQYSLFSEPLAECVVLSVTVYPCDPSLPCLLYLLIVRQASRVKLVVTLNLFTCWVCRLTLFFAAPSSLELFLSATWTCRI